MKYITDCEAECYSREEYDMQIVLGLQTCDTLEQLLELLKEVREDEVRRISKGEDPITCDWIDTVKKIVDEQMSGQVDKSTAFSLFNCQTKGDAMSLLTNLRTDESIRRQRSTKK